MIEACRYLHDTHLEAHSVEESIRLLLERGVELDKQAMAADFPVSRNYYTQAPGEYAGTLSYHFFNLAGLEVATYLAAMHTVTPALVILDKPRVWHDKIKEDHRAIDIGGYMENHVNVVKESACEKAHTSQSTTPAMAVSS